MNITPLLRALSITAFTLGLPDAGGSKALAANTIHGFYVGTWRTGDIGQVIYRYLERTILYLDTGVRAHSFAPKHKCDDHTYKPFRETLRATLPKAESDRRHLVWLDELKAQSCDLILEHRMSRGMLRVEYRTTFYSPVRCSQINSFIRSDRFSSIYDRPILVSGSMSGEARLESDTEILRDIHAKYVTCDDLGPNRIRVTARLPRV
ncbi:hypothetical protein [Microvirga arsenatis]|uniref:Uncharacterized protein n=1 Tax=Microvirga arsenatis TaxID=2692265 RepID=A0ABW9Z330_9HYPH|nr:hypothetical protein [Microvirga arsenatis]NBJ13089.1 hypothetical protein [Microvirga arsenatis]NBJ26840.1 hypothetical protein [Microvirga arsenatis]